VPLLRDLIFEAEIAARALGDALTGRGLRLGVTGLSRSGKTVFITALINNLLRRGRLPVLEAAAEGRIAGARLEPQPDDSVPRFAFEDHWASLTAPNRAWPESTRRISEVRLAVDFESAKSWTSRRSELTLDIVDYPGEWLLDLLLLDKSYEQWSRETMLATESADRARLAAEWLRLAGGLDPNAAADESVARVAAKGFTEYLKQAKADAYALSTLPPGRFLMPGDLEGSPALTFAPLRLNGEGAPRPGSLGAMMERRFEAYKTHVVKPFFRDHFSRIDRQIVLVDALSALNSGPAALRDLETALTEVLRAFRVGETSALAALFRPRADRILFAATKADHLHHASHDRLENVVRLITERAAQRAKTLGATIDVVAIAAVRSTREAEIRQAGATYDAVIGVPEKGETLDGQTFDGETEVATFPGQLPDNAADVVRGAGLALSEHETGFRFLKFRPPRLAVDGVAPHIRLDRALQFLLGDKLL